MDVLAGVVKPSVYRLTEVMNVHVVGEIAFRNFPLALDLFPAHTAYLFYPL